MSWAVEGHRPDSEGIDTAKRQRSRTEHGGEAVRSDGRVGRGVGAQPVNPPVGIGEVDLDAVVVPVGRHRFNADAGEANSLWIIRTAQNYIDSHGSAQPFGPEVPRREPLPPRERRSRAAALAPRLRAMASRDQPMVGHFTDSDVVQAQALGLFEGRLDELRAATARSPLNHYWPS